MIRDIHEQSRGTYGWPRIHAELTLGLGEQVNHKRVARLMRAAGIQGLYRRRRRGCTIRNPADPLAADLVNRQFTVDEPNRLWLTDITEHPTLEGKVYCAAVMDAFSRRIVGWSIADHMRVELVIDALGMATLRRKSREGATILHSDHGSQGGFNWWSQHPDREVERWHTGPGRSRSVRTEGRSRRRVARRSPGVKTACGSGRRSPPVS